LQQNAILDPQSVHAENASNSHSAILYCKTSNITRHLENLHIIVTLSNGPVTSLGYTKVQYQNYSRLFNISYKYIKEVKEIGSTSERVGSFTCAISPLSIRRSKHSADRRPQADAFTVRSSYCVSKQRVVEVLQ